MAWHLREPSIESVHSFTSHLMTCKVIFNLLGCCHMNAIRVYAEYVLSKELT